MEAVMTGTTWAIDRPLYDSRSLEELGVAAAFALLTVNALLDWEA